MGTADIVPGVSGGTIVFITGIYSELISTIAGLGPSTVADLFKLGIVETWKYNLSFLIALVGGILTAVVLISNVVHSLQDTILRTQWVFHGVCDCFNTSDCKIHQ